MLRPRSVRALVPLLCLCVPAHAGPVGARMIDIREHIELAKDRYATACARDHTATAAVTLTVKARRSIEVETVLQDTSTEPVLSITTPTDDAFAQCFAREAMSDRRARYFTQTFSTDIVVTLDRPDRILKRVVDEWLAEEDTCRPRAGAIPTSITIDITSDDVEMAVKLAIKPANAAIEACERTTLDAVLLNARIDTGVWKPTLHLTRKLTPHVSNARLREMTAFYAPQAAAACVPSDVEAAVDDAITNDKKPPRIGTMSVAVQAKRDAADFVVVVRSGNKTRDACVATSLKTSLREHFDRTLEDGTSFFRIDGNARAHHRFEIETQRQLDERDEAVREWRRRIRS